MAHLLKLCTYYINFVTKQTYRYDFSKNVVVTLKLESEGVTTQTYWEKESANHEENHYTVSTQLGKDLYQYFILL